VKADQGIDQRMIVAYLALKRLSARAIHEDSRITLRPDAMAHGTVGRYLDDAPYSPSITEATAIEVQRIQAVLFCSPRKRSLLRRCDRSYV
jgi:hypothetical protein